MTSRRTTRGRPLGWAAWLAAFALLAQGLWPASAMARVGDADFHVQMCIPQGMTDQAPAPGHAGDDCCGSCVLSPAATPVTSVAVPLPVRYEIRQDRSARPIDTPEPRARGPPRPPSRGPPSIV
jgi:hypothetical protein